MVAICPEHEQEMKLIPPGISRKTGKPYKAFRACPVTSCNETMPEPDRAPQGAYKRSREIMEEVKNKDEDLESIDIDEEVEEVEPQTAEEKMWRAKEEREAKREKEKSKQISRLTLAKTYIQAGVSFDAAMENGDLDKWYAWVDEEKIL